MDKNKLFKAGDKIQIGDGRIGVVTHVEKDPIAQGAAETQQLIVKFPDGSTQVVTGAQLTLI